MDTDSKRLEGSVTQREYDEDVGQAYRRRLLRFDIRTNAWTVLKPLCDADVTPTGNDPIDGMVHHTHDGSSI